jgi:hypothetical protein
MIPYPIPQARFADARIAIATNSISSRPFHGISRRADCNALKIVDGAASPLDAPIESAIDA